MQAISVSRIEVADSENVLNHVLGTELIFKHEFLAISVSITGYIR